MSFPKAPLKRFNEHVGCAPAPGTYEVRGSDGMKGAVSFPKSQRFQKAKEDLTSSMHSLENDRDFVSPVRSRKQNASLGSTPNLSRRSEKDPDFVREMKKQKKLEKEIRSLIKERAEQDKRLQSLEEEFKKTEAKLTTAIREKSLLSANMASLERQLADLHKANELLKVKFSDDSTKTKMNNVCAELMEAKNKLNSKEKELSYMQINFEGQVKVLHSDLEASKTNLNALQEKNKYLEDAHQEAKLQSEDLEMEMDKLHVLIEQLRGENKTLHMYLAEAQDQIADIRGQMCTKERDYENARKLAKSSMEEQSQVFTAKHEDMEQKLQVARRDLEAALEREARLGEKLAETDQAKEKVIGEKAETEQKLLDHIAEISCVTAQVEKYKLQLAQSEELLKEKDVASLTQRNLFIVKETEFCQHIKELDERCRSLEQEKEKFATERQDKEETLNAEVELLKVKLVEEQEGSRMLQQKQAQLLTTLKQEEELTKTLRQELLQVQEEMLTERSLLEEELEGTLDELDRLQLEEEQAEKIIAKLEHENKLRSEELSRLALTLKEKNAELEKVHVSNSKAVAQFEEERRATLCKLGEVTAEFESCKVSLEGEVESLKTRNSCLLEKVTDLDKCVLDTQQQLEEMHQSSAKAKEENARMLLDAQTNLAVKEDEMKKSEDCHFAKITELHNKLEQQNEAFQKDHKELDSLRQESIDEKVVVDLKEEIKKWRTLYEDLHHKVKPFQQQLDMFEAEKNALLNENGAAQDELNKLSDAYAKLLGHQNQRQKIKHVMKLKEENIQLKQEISRLRGQLSKEKTVLGGKRFDPSKSFQGDSKENVVPKTPLREGNRKVMI